MEQNPQHPLSSELEKIATELYEDEPWQSPDTFLGEIEQALYDAINELNRMYRTPDNLRLERAKELAEEMRKVINGHIS